MTLNICLAGATGWAGAELSRGIADSADLMLVSGVSRTHYGRRLGEVLADDRMTAPLCADAATALEIPCDVFVEYTCAKTAKDNILRALRRGAHVVVGTSGLTDADYAEIDGTARQLGRGVLACGNFALTAVLLLKCAELVAKQFQQWEIVEYASDAKVDVPSGTVRELARRLGAVRRPDLTVGLDQTLGPVEARGADMDGTRVHSVRLPGHTLGVDVVFGMADQTLVLRHNAGSSARPYVEGGLLAIRKVSGLVGVHHGLDSVLDL
ncbi:MAG: 4-hydroxy-tetrahydrodipicolinate reductase [Erythrobacter sp.]